LIQTALKGKRMASLKSIFIAIGIMAVLVLAGCTQSSQHRRWDRHMERARFEAALESIEQGRLEYAMLLLEELIESESSYSEQARDILVEIRAVHQNMGQARSGTMPLEKPSMTN
jgi:Tfp pilus assembly protein PilF